MSQTNGKCKHYHQPHPTLQHRVVCHDKAYKPIGTTVPHTPLPIDTSKTYDFSSYQGAVDKIWKGVATHSKAYERLETLCLEFGNRISGSETLERVIDWGVDLMKKDGLENVQTEEVKVPHWVRGEAQAYLTIKTNENDETNPLIRPHIKSERKIPLTLLAIGQSVGTPNHDIIHAPIVVVTNFAEFDALVSKDPKAVEGKMVLFNFIYTEYCETVAYRSQSAKKAQAFGAKAVLIRSVTPFSLNTPHTGTMSLADIPAAAITLENAELIARLAGKGKEIIGHLRLSCVTHPDATSRNIIAEFIGREKPNEIVVIGAHIDSWDVGQGAHDDGQGCIVALESIRILKEMGLRPRRTIRVVWFTDEEVESRGADVYLANHKSEIPNVVAAMETDMGAFTSIGFGFTGTPAARHMLQSLSTLLKPYQADTIAEDGDGVDISPLIEQGVPGLLLRFDPQWWYQDYFMYHHTEADTIDKIDPSMLLQNVQVFASMAYLLAEIEETLPRTK